MPEVILVSQDGCKPCLRVKRLLEELRPEVAGLVVTEVALASEEGMRRAIEDGITYPPAVYVDGKFLAKGKVREEDLRRALGARPRASSP